MLAVVAYDHPATGDTYMLVFHQAIMVPNLNSNLLCSNQMRANDLRVNDELKHCIDQPTEDHYAIVVPDTDGTGEGLRTPLSIHGVVSYFLSRRLMVEEYESTDLNHILDMTDSDTEWDKSSPKLAEQEEAMLDLRGILHDQPPRPWMAEQVVAMLNTHPQSETRLELFGKVLGHCALIGAIRTGGRHHITSPKDLATQWGIVDDATQ